MMRPLTGEEKAANWRACRRYLKIYFWLAMLPFLAFIWGAGYITGMINHCRIEPRNTESKL